MLSKLTKLINLYIIIGLSVCLTSGVAWMDGRSDDVRRPATGASEGRGGGTVRGLGVDLQHGLGVMPGEIAAESGRLSASVPTPRRSSSRLGSGLLITTVVVQAYKEAGQMDRRAGMHAGGPNRAKIVQSAILARKFYSNWTCTDFFARSFSTVFTTLI